MPHRVRLLLTLILIVLSLSGCCAPGALHCGSAGKPTYPTVPLPPGARDVQRPPQNDASLRVTIYHIDIPPHEVQTFYRTSLLNMGWELVATHAGGNQSFDYVNGAGNPAFSLGVIATADSAGQSVVTLRMIMSGPFSTANWPQP